MKVKVLVYFLLDHSHASLTCNMTKYDSSSLTSDFDIVKLFCYKITSKYYTIEVVKILNVFFLTGYTLLAIDYDARVTLYVDRQSANCFIYIGIGIFSSILVSLCWWENPLQATNHLQVQFLQIF